MQVSAPEKDDLRRLAELRLERPVVLSLYLDLDPVRFASPPAKASAVRSLLDEAERRLEQAEGLRREDRVELETALERARGLLEGGLSADGAHAVAVFSSPRSNLLETLKLPRSVESRVAFGRSPLVGPLAGLERRERWCVALVNRRDGRIFLGAHDGLREVERLRDDVPGQHDQGGWSQARYQRARDKEAGDHLARVAESLLRRLRRRPFERLMTGGPEEAVAEFEGKLHAYLRERLAGRIEVDVENAAAEAVLAAAGPQFDELDRERERRALERMEQGSRALAGVEEVLAALNERRVEALLLDDDFSAPGSECPECGWLGPAGPETCPADGTRLERRDDVREPAIELALQQAADALPLRHEEGRLGDRGGIAALLRF